MGMQFTVAITGTVEFTDLDASDIFGLDAGLLEDVIRASVRSGEFTDANITSGTVTIEARARLEGVEVSASDLGDFDVEEALSEAVSSYNASFSNIDYEVEASPTGFEALEEAIGRESAIEAYTALDDAGFEVVAA